MPSSELNWYHIVWVSIGFLGQGLFTMRFIVQWFVSEKQKESVIPLSFWYLSLSGGAIMLAYAIYRMDPVFITGQSFGVIVYVRNLVLIYRKQAESTAELESEQSQMDANATIKLDQVGPVVSTVPLSKAG